MLQSRLEQFVTICSKLYLREHDLFIGSSLWSSPSCCDGVLLSTDAVRHRSLQSPVIIIIIIIIIIVIIILF